MTDQHTQRHRPYLSAEIRGGVLHPVPSPEHEPDTEASYAIDQGSPGPGPGHWLYLTLSAAERRQWALVLLDGLGT